MITIAFDSGEGLQAGQSQLKFKDMIFGTVQSLDLAPDHSHVRVSVRTTSKARDLLTEATVFWVVKPRLSNRLEARPPFRAQSRPLDGLD